MAGKHVRTHSGQRSSDRPKSKEGLPLLFPAFIAVSAAGLALLNSHSVTARSSGPGHNDIGSITAEQQDMNFGAVFRFTGGCGFGGVVDLPDGKSGGNRVKIRTELTMDPRVRSMMQGYTEDKLRLEDPLAQVRLLVPTIIEGEASAEVVELDAELHMDGEEGEADIEVTLPNPMPKNGRVALSIGTAAVAPGMSAYSEMFCYSLTGNVVDGIVQWSADPYDPVYFHPDPALAFKSEP